MTCEYNKFLLKINIEAYDSLIKLMRSEKLESISLNELTGIRDRLEKK